MCCTETKKYRSTVVYGIVILLIAFLVISTVAIRQLSNINMNLDIMVENSELQLKLRAQELIKNKAIPPKQNKMFMYDTLKKRKQSI